MPPDATDTKRRLLRAAVEEFARHGLAGARVDRIAEAAAANKRSIYMHFGSKEELFDRAVADSMLELAQSLTLDDGDLPRYAGDMFDRLQRWPHVTRLYHWAALEREQPFEPEVAGYRRRVEAIAAAQAAGEVRDDVPAADLMAMVIAVVISWDSAAWSLRELQAEHGSPDAAARRAAVVSAVAGLTRPPGPSPALHEPRSSR
ncbi:TetR family transcriptional regulator [Pseudokineococcus marinus]|uniref:TetR family transcriptional regulator n=1 Tax=Pseudokineococcus marinus TaxID=351215 RepID=A0A849BHE6_9ACTN|nr:TetR family transcriptional regulator [Pseudokineococcus marinus]NNH22550.1 TetR family transcriptional regulator [Pseudokineococcus marinus]